MNDENIERLKEQYPALVNKSYFNFGAQGVLSVKTIEAIKNSFLTIQKQGPLSDKLFGWIENELRQTRASLAEEFGGSPNSYCLTQSTTDGCNIVFWGINWRKGDHLLITDCEHPGVVIAAEQAAKRLELTVDYCKIAHLQDDDAIIDEFKNSLHERTRLAAVSHVLWNTGKVLPATRLVTLLRDAGIPILIDGAQSAGVLPLDLSALGADFYAVTGHKWVGGPEGVGTLYVRPESLESIEPTFVGWRSVNWTAHGIDGWRKDAGRFEVATAAFPLLAGLRTALSEHRAFGSAQQRYEAQMKNVESVRVALQDLPGIELFPESGSGLVAFKFKTATPGSVVSYFEENKCIVRTIPHPPCVRASVHYLNSRQDLSVLTEAAASFHQQLARTL